MLRHDLILYAAVILGAFALLLMMPKRHLNLKPVGAILGAATLGGLWLFLSRQFEFWAALPPPGFGGEEKIGIEPAAFGFHYIFGFIGIAGSVAVITNKRPVYAALWFVMVVLSTAGMFLTLSADFIAFAMVIIYGGAILVTYMFVIMLASEQQQSANFAKEAPEYERIAREPFAAVAAGFFLLAVLLSIMFEPMEPVADAKGLSDNMIVYGSENPSEPDLQKAILTRRAEQSASGTPLTPAQATAINLRVDSGNDAPPNASLSNVERVGLDLFESHPLGLELAGVILLVALIGAIVIAKTQVHEEDEVQDPHATGAA